MNLTEKMLRLRHLHGYKQAHLADQLGIAQSTYSDLESGKTQPSLAIIEKLADFYGLCVGEFLSRSVNELVIQVVDKQKFVGGK